VSFAIFLVPVGVALVLLRALLCRRCAPLPEAGLVGALRASLVVLVTVVVTVVADWIPVLRVGEPGRGRPATSARRCALPSARIRFPGHGLRHGRLAHRTRSDDPALRLVEQLSGELTA
jgi:hypothetical protein